jgi:hypothetical protein
MRARASLQRKKKKNGKINTKTLKKNQLLDEEGGIVQTDGKVHQVLDRHTRGF